MSKKKLPSPQEEHEEKVEQTTNMITAEDLIEQAVYSANTPECCKGGQQAENMLGMLGANLIDSDVYHIKTRLEFKIGEITENEKDTHPI